MGHDRADENRLATVKALQETYDILKTSSKNWSAAKGNQFLAASQKMLSHHSWLAGQVLTHGKHFWSIVQRHHLLVHLGEQAQVLRPRKVWSYESDTQPREVQEERLRALEAFVELDERENNWGHWRAPPPEKKQRGPGSQRPVTPPKMAEPM